MIYIRERKSEVKYTRKIYNVRRSINTEQDNNINI